MAQPVCSLIIVNYNGVRHLQHCLSSLEHLAYPRDRLDLIVIENGPDKASLDFVRQVFPAVRTFANTENNFVKALNLGVSLSQGGYIGFLNNDVTLEPRWLEELVALLEAEKAAGAAGGKILFKDRRINSVGHRNLPHFYVEDLGFNEEDHGQYDAVAEVEGLCWAAVLFRRRCLEDVGHIDEDFVMYFEDVDYAMRCRAAGWRLLYSPRAVAYHEFHGTSSSPNIPYYFCNRNRLLHVAKHAAAALPHVVTTSEFFNACQYEQLFDCIPIIIKKLVDHQDTRTVGKILTELTTVLEPIYGSEALDQLLARMQVILGHRNMSVGIYGPALHTMADEQEFICLLAATIQDQFDVTYVVHQSVDLYNFETRYGVDLSKCALKIIHSPLDAELHEKLGDATSTRQEVRNRLNPVSEESGNYDLFINSDITQEIVPLSPLSIAVCHSSDGLGELPLSAKEYTLIFAGSQRAIERLREVRGPVSAYRLHPPAARAVPPVEKENRSVSMTRFERQVRSIFETIRREYSTIHLPDPQEVAKIVFSAPISADRKFV